MVFLNGRILLFKLATPLFSGTNTTTVCTFSRTEEPSICATLLNQHFSLLHLPPSLGIHHGLAPSTSPSKTAPQKLATTTTSSPYKSTLPTRRKVRRLHHYLSHPRRRLHLLLPLQAVMGLSYPQPHRLLPPVVVMGNPYPQPHRLLALVAAPAAVVVEVLYRHLHLIHGLTFHKS